MKLKVKQARKEDLRHGASHRIQNETEEVEEARREFSRQRV